MSMHLFNFVEGEVWGIQVPSVDAQGRPAMAALRVRIVGMTPFGVAFIDDMNEAAGIEFLSGAVPFRARRLMTVEEAKEADERRAKAMAERVGAEPSAPKLIVP